MIPHYLCNVTGVGRLDRGFHLWQAVLEAHPVLQLLPLSRGHGRARSQLYVLDGPVLISNRCLVELIDAKVTLVGAITAQVLELGRVESRPTGWLQEFFLVQVH